MPLIKVVHLPKEMRKKFYTTKDDFWHYKWLWNSNFTNFRYQALCQFKTIQQYPWSTFKIKLILYPSPEFSTISITIHTYLELLDVVNVLFKSLQLGLKWLAVGKGGWWSVQRTDSSSRKHPINPVLIWRKKMHRLFFENKRFQTLSKNAKNNKWGEWSVQRTDISSRKHPINPVL